AIVAGDAAARQRVARVGVDVGVAQVQVGIAYVDARVFARLILYSCREPPAVVVGQSRGTVRRVVHRRLVPGYAEAPFALRRELVVGPKGDAPRVTEVQRQCVGGPAFVLDLQLGNAAPARPGNIGQQFPALIEPVLGAQDERVGQVYFGLGVIGQRLPGGKPVDLGVAPCSVFYLGTVRKADARVFGGLQHDAGVPAPRVAIQVQIGVAR